MASRQSKYQAEHIAKGLCRFCSRPLAQGSKGCCSVHLQIGRERQRAKAGTVEWQPGRRGRPPIGSGYIKPKRKPRNKEYGLSAKLRFDILKRDLFTCRYCGRKAPGVAISVDHIIPVSLGGTSTESNLATSCMDCNMGKGDWNATADDMPAERDRRRAGK